MNKYLVLGILMVSSLLVLLSANSSATAGDYADNISVCAGTYNGFVGSVATYLATDTDYTWCVNVTGYNITSVTIGDVSATNTTAPRTNGSWTVTATPGEVFDFEDNCTYMPLSIVVTNYNSSQSDNTNTTIQANITALPCIENPQTGVSIAVTDINDSTITSTDRTAKSITFWGGGLHYNASHDKCSYGMTNVDNYESTAFFVADASPCVFAITRTVSDYGSIVISQGEAQEPNTPSNLPTIILSTLGGLIIGAAVTRSKSTGSDLTS